MRDPAATDPSHDPTGSTTSLHPGRETAPTHRDGAPSTPPEASTRSAAADPQHAVFRCTLHGEIDSASRDHLALVARAFRASACTSARVDVSGVTFVDSSALALLLSMRTVAADRGGRVVLVGPGRRLRRLLTIAGVVELFVVVEPTTD